MASRLELHEELCKLLNSREVYFQPPASVKMKYPAIKYSLQMLVNEHADDIPYVRSRAYTIILIDKNPDSEFVDKINSLPLCQFSRSYQADNLNHYVFTLYY